MPNELQGVVRGFTESRQRNMDGDEIVWTFQLERHSEMEERLDPIPVEMRGMNFSGHINEGNVVRLYEKAWHGGIVRTKRVYDVTFQADIIAHGLPKFIQALRIGVIILVISVCIFFIGGFIIFNVIGW